MGAGEHPGRDVHGPYPRFVDTGCDYAAVGTAAPVSDSVCGLPNGDQDIPLKGPEAEWVLIDGVSMPTSDEHGPGVEEESIHSCFAHSPAGALFAYFAFLADSASSDNAPADVFRSRVVDDENSRERIATLEEYPRGPGDQGIDAIGYAVLSYTPTTVTINVAYESQEPQALVAMPATLRWQDGDWYVVIAASDPPAAELDDLEGYVEWSGL